MKTWITPGQTDYTVQVFIPDSASTDGSGKTGLVAANLTVSYSRVETDNDVVIADATSSLNNLAALTTAHTDWGLKEVSSTLAPGLYRLDIADAVFASGAFSAVVYVMVTTSSAAASPMEFILGPVIDTVTTATNVTTVNGLAANVITATSIASDAITAAKVADGAIDAATFAAGAITATVIAADAIGASELAADAVAEIADAVWDEAMSGHVTSGTFGQRSQGIRSGTAQAGAASTITLDASASASNDFYDGMILITGGTGAGQSRGITGYDGTTKVATISPNWVTNPSSDSVFIVLPAAFLTIPTSADIADAIWEEDLSDHSGVAGSTAEGLADASAAGDPWGVALPGGYASGTAGKIIGDNINASVGSRATQASIDTIETFLDTEVAAILEDTDELQSDWADGGRLDLILDARASQTSLDTVDNFLDTEIASILAAVDTEVAAIIALLDNARGEPTQGTPPVNPDAVTKIDYLYKAWRNKTTQTASEYALYADDGTTKDHEATVSDDGSTFTRGEITTGA